MHDAGKPGIDLAEPQRLCGVVPGLEVSLGKLLLLRRSLRLEHRLVELGISEQALEAVVLLFQLFEAFGLCGLHAAVELLPAVIVGADTSRTRQASATDWPWLRSCSAVRSLRMICSGVWHLRFMGLLLAKSGRWGGSHKGWLSFRGPRHWSTKEVGVFTLCR